MVTFNYKIIDKEGKNVEGKMDAKDRFDLYHILKKDGGTVISVKEEKKTLGLSLLNSFTIFSGVKAHDKITFARNLGQMIDAGLPITRSLSIMGRQAKKGAFKDVLVGLNDSLSKGETLSDGMKKFPKVFNALFVSMVKAGEESGNLSLALRNVGQQLEKTYQLNKKIKGAMMYPAVILCLMVIIGVLMMVYMVPTLTSTFVGLGIDLPLSTKIIIGISNFLKSYFIFAFLGLVLLIVLSVLWFKTKNGQRFLDTVVLRLPIIGELSKQINTARTARTLSSLLSSGVDIVVAISVTKDVVQNSYYKDVLNKIEIVIQKGEPISSVFITNEKLYPLFVGEMVAVGEETGKIGDMLLGVAQFYEEEIDQKTKDLSSIIEPVLMVVIGGVVGFFAISMISPIYSIGDSIK